MGTATNAFWREVLDYIPGLVLLFRIDDHEQAHLIFVSDGVADELGFKPEEYVLASEGESIIKSELEKLVDTVAALTHDHGQEPECMLSDRNGMQHKFRFEFRLFRPKSSKVNLLSITLFPVIEKNTEQIEGRSPVPSVIESDSSMPFVAESMVMRSVLDRIDELSHLTQHIVLSGERSTGKRTLAGMLARKSAVLKKGTQVWELDLEKVTASGGTRLFAGLEIDNANDSILGEVEADLVLVIGEMGLLQPADQEGLMKMISSRLDRGYQTRIIATTSDLIDGLLKSGRIGKEFYYQLSFLTVSVPPLRDREGDLLPLAKAISDRTVSHFGIKDRISESELSSWVKNRTWDGNIGEFVKYIASRILTGSDHRVGVTEKAFDMRSGKGRKSVFFSLDGIYEFDRVSKEYIDAVLLHTGGRIYGKGGAAELLGLKPTTLQSKIKKLSDG